MCVSNAGSVATVIDTTSRPTGTRNGESPTATVIDIEAEDRVGLLYTVCRVLYGLGLSIALARISTERGAVLDTFYVTDVKGSKIEDPERLARIEPELRRGLGG